MVSAVSTGTQLLQGNSIAPVMRELVGRLLGIGMCDGKQLVRQLNRFDFTHAEVRPAAWQCGGRSHRATSVDDASSPGIVLGADAGFRRQCVYYCSRPGKPHCCCGARCSWRWRCVWRGGCWRTRSGSSGRSGSGPGSGSRKPQSRSSRPCEVRKQMCWVCSGSGTRPGASKHQESQEAGLSWQQPQHSSARGRQ